MRLTQRLREIGDELPHVFIEPSVKVAEHTTNARVTCRQPRPGRFLKNTIQLLAFAETVEEHRKRAQVKSRSA